MNTIPARFGASATANITRAAVVTTAGTTTYGELLTQSQAVARLLGRHGIGRGHRVGICMEKSPEVFAVMLGTMLAGAACVPLEVSTPPARLTAIMKSAEVSALFLTYSPRLELASLRAMTCLRVFHSGAPTDQADAEATWAEVLSNGVPAESSPPVESDPAYVLFTSGSSGEPKGVVLSHAAALAFVDWAIAVIGLGPDDRVASHAALGFDLTVFDIYATLFSGAALYPVPEMQRGVASYLTKFIETNAITVWYSVPTAAARIAEVCAKKGSSLPSVRHLIVAGEVFPTRSLATLRSSFPSARTHNWYGPTETNVVTFHEVTAADDGSRPMPIGRACPFAKVRLLGEDLRDVPVDTKGVLYAGGLSLMSEYWRDADKTQRSIIELDGEAYYRTGDVATMSSDGEYRYVGRADDMVKIQGYRVEPAEVESALRDAVGTEDAAVIATEREGETVLVAFVSGVEATEPLQKALRARLPNYMVPRDILIVPNLPRNDRGKIDRRELTRMLSS